MQIAVEQAIAYNDCEIEVRPHNEAFKMLIVLGMKRRWVFFDTAGRITHIRNVNNPELLHGPPEVEQPKLL
jgi:hypothetical protein